MNGLNGLAGRAAGLVKRARAEVTRAGRLDSEGRLVEASEAREEAAVLYERAGFVTTAKALRAGH